MAIPFKKVKNKLGLDDTMPFGRHQGYTVEEILKDRPQYIDWLMTNTSLKFYPSVHEQVLLSKVDKITKSSRKTRSYFYDGQLNGEQGHYDISNQDYWEDLDDIPF